MSTDKEKAEAISHSIRVAEKRVKRLEALKYINAISKAESYELDMCYELIKKGKQLLGSNFKQDKDWQE